MAFSWQEETYPAGESNITVDIEYLDRSYIHVYLNNVESTSFTWNSDTVITLDTPLTDTTLVTLVRRTDKEFLYIKFADGAAFIRDNLDTQNTQFLHLAQEMVEGRSIEGFYGSISMNGYRITNLGSPVNPSDATTKQYVDDYNTIQDNRITNLEGVFVPGLTTAAYPWSTVVVSPGDTFSPGFVFDKAEVFLNGVHQEPGYAFIVVDNTIVFAEELVEDTRIYAILGENILPDDGLVSAAQFAAMQGLVDGLDARLTVEEDKIQPVSQGGTGNTSGNIPGNAATASEANKLSIARAVQVALNLTTATDFDGTADVDVGVSGILGVANGGTGNSTGTVAQLTTARTFQTNLASTTATSFNGTANNSHGVTGTLPITNGGTGNTTGLAASATKLATARTIQTNLGSTSTASFDGTANAAPGVTGTLGIANGGTGASTATAALTALGGQTFTGVTDASNAAAGRLGEYSTSTGASTALTSASAKSITSLALTAGDWDLEGVVVFEPTGATITATIAGVGTTNNAIPSSAYDLSTGRPGATAYFSSISPIVRISVSAATTVYLIGYAEFAAGSVTASGRIRARRVR